MPIQDKLSSHIRSAEQTNSLAYKLVKTQQLPNTSTHQFTNSPTHQLTNSPPHHLINSSTHQLINSSTHQLTNSPTHQLTNSLTQKLKFLSFILQSCSNFHSILAKISVINQVKSHYFQLFTHLVLSIFKTKTCILHHLAFLVQLPTRNFSCTITRF